MGGAASDNQQIRPEAAGRGADCLRGRIAIIDQKLGARASGFLKLLELLSRAARQPFPPIRVDILVAIGSRDAVI